MTAGLIRTLLDYHVCSYSLLQCTPYKFILILSLISCPMQWIEQFGVFCALALHRRRCIYTYWNVVVSLQLSNKNKSAMHVKAASVGYSIHTGHTPEQKWSVDLPCFYATFLPLSMFSGHLVPEIAERRTLCPVQTDAYKQEERVICAFNSLSRWSNKNGR